MNKLYNNLSIENLIETDWFNQFDEMQKQVITVGLKENLDVLIYAKKEFTWKQMVQIKWGLENNLDVSVYANPDFSVEQMREIAIGLIEDLDVSKYAKPEITVEEMRKIIEELKDEKLRVW